jgi:hypothetical protein
MPRLAKVVLAVLGVAACLVGALGVSLYVLPDAMCANEPLGEVLSPDGARKAVVFQRDCGATTGFSTQVSVIASSSSTLDNSSGNVFVADTDHGSASAGPGGGPWVSVHWLAPDQLLVRHQANARVFKAELQFRAVHIRYEHHAGPSGVSASGQ